MGRTCLSWACRESRGGRFLLGLLAFSHLLRSHTHAGIGVGLPFPGALLSGRFDLRSQSVGPGGVCGELGAGVRL